MDDDRPTDPNELLDYTIGKIMYAVEGAFLELWDRPEADLIVLGFLDGSTRLMIGRDGIDVVRTAPQLPEDVIRGR